MDDSIITSGMTCTSWLNSTWIVMIGCALMALAIPHLDFVARHGKLLRQQLSVPLTGRERERRSKGRQQEQSFQEEGPTTISEDLFGFDKLTVPKKYFAHFYIVGAVGGLAIILVRLIYLRTTFGLGAMIMFELHVLRRLYECTYYTIYGNSQMHITGYVAGMAHYVLTPCTLLAASVEREAVFGWRHAAASSLSPGVWSAVSLGLTDTLFKATSIVLFVLANSYQFECHYILYECKLIALSSADAVRREALVERDLEVIKEMGVGVETVNTAKLAVNIMSAETAAEVSLHSKQKKRDATLHNRQEHSSRQSSSRDSEGTVIDKYLLPSGSLFDYVSCPHYLLEIVSYLSIWLQLSTSLTCMLLFLWVTVNLSVVAYNQFVWYMDMFPEAFLKEKKNWRILIPFVW